MEVLNVAKQQRCDILSTGKAHLEVPFTAEIVGSILAEHSCMQTFM